VESSNPNTPKRRYPRRGFRKPIGILYQGHFWLCLGEEVGEGGIGINSARTLPENALVIITFFVPGAEIAVIRCRIRYHTAAKIEGQTRLGLQFLDAGFELKKKIRDYIAAKSEAEAQTDFVEKRIA
jgi:PilZ domain